MKCILDYTLQNRFVVLSHWKMYILRIFGILPCVTNANGNVFILWGQCSWISKIQALGKMVLNKFA